MSRDVEGLEARSHRRAGRGEAHSKSNSGFHKMPRWTRPGLSWIRLRTTLWHLGGHQRTAHAAEVCRKLYTGRAIAHGHWYPLIQPVASMASCAMQALIRACRRLVRQFLMKQCPESEFRESAKHAKQCQKALHRCEPRQQTG